MAAPRKTTVEEEDLDDLDDVLEQFNAPPKPAAKPAPASTAATSQTPPTKDTTSTAPISQQKKADPLGLEGLGDDFARELTKGMESLFRDIAQGAGLEDIPDLSKVEEGTTDEEKLKVFQAAWEEMLVEGMDGSMSAEDVGDKGKAAESAPQASTSTSSVPPGSFQESVKKMMEKLKESDRKADEAIVKEEDLEDMFSRLVKDVEGTETEEEFQGLLENMMSALMSKDILYEPLKELNDKYPTYLKDNASKISAEDHKRYTSQSKVVAQIVAIFESPNFDQDDTKMGVKVAELMQEMQEFGSPPSEIMGPLPPGINAGPDGMPNVPEACTIA
ncbi:Pex19-domain-containing protein [Cubamyces sp. BRFM 1775]|nr:Pex19-domain-containing protein [Cubamyces sp. BRFM 1775]